MTTLYIGNLGMEVDESDINELFRGFDVRAVHMKFGYCFVKFVDREQAGLGTALDGTELFGRRIKIDWARPRNDHWDCDWDGNYTRIKNRSQSNSNSSSSLASSASNQSIASSNRQPVTENTLLECEICFVRFDYHVHRPRSLPCGHSLCSLCITDTLKAIQDTENVCLLCPFCRTSCGPHKTRVGQFPETFFILRMLEVEAEKSKKGAKKENEEDEVKKREMEEKKKEQEKKEEDKRKEENRKKQEEEYLRFQKQMIGIDSTVSGIMSCKEHLESLEDLHKEQLSMEQQLKMQRKKMLEEVGKIEAEIKELSEQMLNTEVWVATGKNLLNKFDIIQEDLKKEDNENNIESCYDAAESCCLVTQRWTEESLPEIDKMNLFIEQKQTSTSSSNGSVKLSAATSCAHSNQGASAKFVYTEGTDITCISGENIILKTKHHDITKMKEYLSMSFEELRVQYYQSHPCKICNRIGFYFSKNCSTCCNEHVGATSVGFQNMESKEVVELTDALGELNRISEVYSDEGSNSSLSASGIHQSISSPRKILKRSKLGVLLEKFSEGDGVPDTDTEVKASYEEPVTTSIVSSTGESSTTGSIPRTFSPFVVTNTTPSFNFGSTVNPFDTSLLDTTTAVSSMSLSPSVSATSVAITPVLAAETRSTIGSSTQLASSVTNVKGNSIVYITQTVSDTTNSITPFSFLTNSAKASVANISQTTVTSATKTTANINFNKSTVPTSRTDLVNDIASSAAPLLSSFETSTVSSPFSLGNLSHPSKNGISNTRESVADAAKQITAASFSFVNSSSASVRPKVNFACGLTKAFTSFPNISTDYVSQSESSLCSTNIERKTTIAGQKDLPKKVFSFCSIDLTNFSGFRFLNSNTSVKSCANNVPFAATAFTNDTTTTSNTDVSASAPKSVPLFSPSFFLPIKDFGVRDVGTMTSDNSSTSPVTFPVEAVTTAVSTCTVISPFFDISNNVTSFSSFAKTNNLATMASSMASESVRPKTFCTSSSQIKVSNSDSKCTAIIAEDKSRQKIITKDGKFSSESSCDDKSTNTVPSFKFTMNPGMFSGISFSPSTSMATPNNSDTATKSADLSPACSANSTTAPTISLIEPISFRLIKPKTYNFS